MSNSGKIIYLDEPTFQTFNQVDTMLFPLKESEAQMLLALAPFIGWQTRWTNLNMTQKDLDELVASISDGLMNPQEAGGNEMTPEELCEAVQCGIMGAVPQIGTALAGAINSQSTFVIDPDTGEVVIDTGDSEAEALTGSQNEKKWGGITEVEKGLQEFKTDFENWFGDFPADEAQTVSFFSQKYLCTADITQAVSDYYDHRNLMNPTPQPIDTDTLKGLMFCEGATKQTVASHIIDSVSNDQLLLLSMYAGLSQDQYDQWYSIGDDKPRLGYDIAPCYRVPAETITLNYDEMSWNDWNTEVFTGKPANHLWRVSVQCTQEFINADGDTWDGVYLKPIGGNDTLSTMLLFQTYLYPFTVGEGFGGKLPIGGIYHCEQYKAIRYPVGIKFTIADQQFTQGQLKITLTDLGAL